MEMLKFVIVPGRGIRRCFLMGGLTMWATQPTYRRVQGHDSLGNFYVYALKSILVHSEANNINRNYNWSQLDNYS